MRFWLTAIFTLVFATADAFAQDADFELCAGAGEPSQRIAACTRVLARGAPSTDLNRSYVLSERGYAYLDKGDNDRALSDFNEALGLKPDVAEALHGRGEAFEFKGDYDRALLDFNEALRLRPDSVNFLNSRALAFDYKSDHDRALSDFNEALRLDPGAAYVLINRGMSSYHKRDYERALSDFNEALRLDPSSADAHIFRGDVYLNKGDDDRALSDYNEALRLKPGFSPALDGRSRAEAAKASGSPPPTPTAVATAAPISPAAVVRQGRYVALIVANGAYRDAALANPRFDADLVAASLAKIGFAVTEKKDLGLDGFEQAIADFAESSKGADVALFYFAGHGFSIATGDRQENLLMATDADFHAKTGLALERGGEPLEHVEETIIGHAKATLIFVDACRNVPLLASRGVGARGFAPFDASAFDGAFVVVSTRQGKTAADGADGQGSPFARAFASVVPTPGLRIEDAAARIREKVRAETSGEQVPDVIRSDLPEGGVVLETGVR